MGVESCNYQKHFKNHYYYFTKFRDTLQITLDHTLQICLVLNTAYRKVCMAKSHSQKSQRDQKDETRYIKSRNKDPVLHCGIELVHFTPFTIPQFKESAGPRVAFCSHKTVS